MMREERAVQIWPLLTLAASLRMTLTYKCVGELIGAGPMSLGGWLEPIQSLREHWRSGVERRS
jgi:hypothetical protein